MTRPYDPSLDALLHPGRARDTFADGRPESRAGLCAEMARLAYCRDHRVLVRSLRRAGFELVTRVERPVGAQGFVAADGETAVLAFRGTEAFTLDPADLAADLLALLVPFRVDGATVGRVHAGFLGALDLAWDEIENALNGLDLPLTTTGHSLGAALATLAACRTPVDEVRTFGSPRVGDRAFARFVAGRRTRILRYRNCCDVVAGLPPEAVGYAHVGRLRYIDAGGAVHRRSNEAFRKRDRRAARRAYLASHARLGNAAVRDFADHAPVNYVRAFTER